MLDIVSENSMLRSEDKIFDCRSANYPDRIREIKNFI